MTAPTWLSTHREDPQPHTCATCCRFELNDVDPDCGLGVCVGTWSHSRRCRKCGARSYVGDVYWEWTTAASGEDCEEYAPTSPTGYQALT